METEGVPGLDLERFGSWFSGEIAEAGAVVSADLVAGGRSNLTFAVSDGAQEWIVRRPPLGHVLATAHDMGREYRVMTSLRGTGVPVPRTYAFCSDPDVIGCEFYVMERVAGQAFRRADQLVPLGRDRTRRISERLVDTLAALHSVVPHEVGLSDFGRPEGFLRRQVGRWRHQLEASRTRDLPAADQLHRQLAEAVPAESATGIVHGDYRLDNVLVDTDEGVDSITAVIDWEMATLGDPLTDLALMVVYGRLGEAVTGADIVDAASAVGFLSESEIVARYAARSDRDLSNFDWYLGLASYKLAAILEGIHFRYLAGQTVGEGFDVIGDVIHPLLDAGLEALR